jgi:hypothetical protein
MDGNGCRASALSDVANHESAALEESHDFEYICVLGAAPSKDRFDKLRRLHTKHARGSSFHLYDVPVGIHAIGVGVARSRVDRNSGVSRTKEALVCPAQKTPQGPSTRRFQVRDLSGEPNEFASSSLRLRVNGGTARTRRIGRYLRIKPLSWWRPLLG